MKQHADPQVGMSFPTEPTEFEYGLLVGLLVGEGSFTGDKYQPQIVVKMHARHLAVFNWLLSRWGGRLYGPYHHGGRRYYQWMARGTYLRRVLMPILDARMSPELDQHSWHRYQAMRAKYGMDLGDRQADPAGPPVRAVE